jgi:hypothetical protein
MWNRMLRRPSCEKQVFFACTVATLTINLSKSAVAAMTGRGHFGWFEREIAFEVRGRVAVTAWLAGASLASILVALLTEVTRRELRGCTAHCRRLLKLCPPARTHTTHVPQQVGLSFSSHVLAVLPAAAIGVAAGAAAVVFTVLNLKVG